MRYGHELSGKIDMGRKWCDSIARF